MEISVSRLALDSSAHKDIVDVFINTMSKNVVLDFVKSSFGTRFSSLNQALNIGIIDKNIPFDESLFWKVTTPDRLTHHWQELQFPVCSPIRTSFMTKIDEYPLISSEEDLHFAEALLPREHSTGLTLASWIGGGRILIEGSPHNFGATVALAWQSRSEMKRIDKTINSMSAVFPPEWGDLLGISTNARVIFNEFHPIISLLSHDHVFEVIPENIFNLEKKIKDCLNTVNGIEHFLVCSLKSSEVFWRYIFQKHNTFYDNIIDTLRVYGMDRIVIWHAHGYGDSNKIIEISGGGVRSTTGYRPSYDKAILAPLDSPAWTLAKKETD